MGPKRSAPTSPESHEHVLQPAPGTPDPQVDQPDTTTLDHGADMSFGTAQPKSRVRWLRRNVTTTITVVTVVVVLVAISVGTGVALTSHSASPAPSVPSARAPTESSPPTGSSMPPVPSSSTPSATPPAQSPVLGTTATLVDVSVAQQVFDSSWSPFATAFATGDRAGVAQYADTDVQEAIAGWYDCGCSP